jgi:hypothetical protein
MICVHQENASWCHSNVVQLKKQCCAATPIKMTQTQPKPNQNKQAAAN